MSRWRPAQPASTALITGEGQARLKAELDDLWRVRRPEVVKALAAAAAEGDRSENAEYIYRKKQLGEIDRRVRYLSKRLETLRIADQKPTDRGAVFFGAGLPTLEPSTSVRGSRSRTMKAACKNSALSDRTRPTRDAAISASTRRLRARH